MISGKIFRAQDCDTGESSVEVYRVPEGWVFNLGASDENADGDCFRSIILSEQDMQALFAHVLAHSL